MPLFELGELASYLQAPEVDNATAQLLLDLVTVEIRWYVGGDRYDAMTDADLLAFKGVALEAVKRAYLNPSGLRSSSIDDYAETFATETFAGVALTAAEQDRIDQLLGRSTGAFTIRPTGTAPDCLPRRTPGHYHFTF